MPFEFHAATIGSKHILKKHFEPSSGFHTFSFSILKWDDSSNKNEFLRTFVQCKTNNWLYFNSFHLWQKRTELKHQFPPMNFVAAGPTGWSFHAPAARQLAAGGGAARGPAAGTFGAAGASAVGRWEVVKMKNGCKMVVITLRPGCCMLRLFLFKYCYNAHSLWSFIIMCCDNVT